jgi:hypothetical protein
MTMTLTFREIGGNARSYAVGSDQPIKVNTGTVLVELTRTLDGFLKAREINTRRAIVFTDAADSTVDANPPAAVLTDELVEVGAKAAFNRSGAHRGCLWEDPKNRHQTTEATRNEFRQNFRAAWNAVMAERIVKPKWEAVKVTEVEYDPSDHEGAQRMLAVGVNAIVKDATTGHMSPGHSKELADRLATYVRHFQQHLNQDVETAKAEPEPPASLTFGQFWDAMTEHLNDGVAIVVFRDSRGHVYSAHEGCAEDGATRIWQVIQTEHPAHRASTRHEGVPLYHLSHLSGFQILADYRNEIADVPF